MFLSKRTGKQRFDFQSFEEYKLSLADLIPHKYVRSVGATSLKTQKSSLWVLLTFESSTPFGGFSIESFCFLYTGILSILPVTISKSGMA